MPTSEHPFLLAKESEYLELREHGAQEPWESIKAKAIHQAGTLRSEKYEARRSRMKVVGLDLGTTSICASLVDGETGEVLDVAKTENFFAVKSAHAWERLQDPEKILAKAQELLEVLVTKHSLIGGIGVTGQMHGIVYLDAVGNALSPLYTWQDGRGDLPFGEGKTYASFLTEKAGYPLATGYGAVTHFYNLKNKLIPTQAVVFCTIQSYVAMKLAELREPKIHVSDAARLGFFALSEGVFDCEALQAVGMQANFFPSVTGELEIIGKTPLGTPVVVAIGDNQASFLGSVQEIKGSILVNVGTGSQISVFSEKPEMYVQASGVETRPLTKDGFLLVGASLSGGLAYALLEAFFRSVIEMAGLSCPSGQSLYPCMNALGLDFANLNKNKSNDKKNRLVIGTQFSGTRERPEQRGFIENLGLENFTPQHFIVGVLEGIVEELYKMYQGMKGVGNADFSAILPSMLIGSGNGLRQNSFLQQLFSEKFGLPLKIPAHQEEAAYGAALAATVAVGYYESIEAAQKIIRYLE